MVPVSRVYLGTTASDTGILGESMRRQQDCANIDVRTENATSKKHLKINFFFEKNLKHQNQNSENSKNQKIKKSKKHFFEKKNIF